MNEEFENVPTPAPEPEDFTSAPEEVTPVMAPTADDIQNDLLNRLDACASNLSQSSLEFGWVAAELWEYVQEDFLEASGGKEKKALSAFTSFIQEREAKDIETRGIVSERLRIARHLTRSKYGAIVSASGGTEPTFHQIRACIFSEGQDLNAGKTNTMIDYCISHNWPPVADIRTYRGVVDPKQKVAPEERRWKLFVKMSQKIMAETDPSDGHYKAAKTVLDTWTDENGLVK